MITPTNALIVVPLLSGRPQARQKTTSHAGNPAWLVVRISFGPELPTLNQAALKTNSECSLAKANSASSLVFALPDLRSASSDLETRPVGPAEGRAVYRNNPDKQPLE
ncbi:hypothetical protein [Pseudomonas khavaziana]|uniref:Uncharacterized protein n=1 Tax=Pseudomonas khavaziana TaxID=2842351 RepID=A0ABZ2DEJ9_9PSED